ncbi:MAG: HAD family phosphatase [Bacteroidetes bacterium]|nr:HAD family phosphatase [Bacteroidota bacterium]
MIKAIFWDNDGVLVDTEKLYYQANKEIFATIGIEISEDVYVEYFLKRSSGTWHLAETKGLSRDDISKLRNERDELYSNLLLNKMEVIDGASETLAKLFGKYKMGIVTSSKKRHFDIIHNNSGLLKYFDFVLTVNDYANSKPEPDPYFKALELSGLKKEECIVVEDSERGLKSALAAGLKCIVIPTNLTKYSNFSGAEKILAKITGVPNYLTKFFK